MFHPVFILSFIIPLFRLMDAVAVPDPFLVPIPIDKLRAHITSQNELISGTFETGWDQEFNFIERKTREDPRYDKETKISNLEANKPKNRYMNVLAADETIVSLPLVDSCDVHSGYINANWITGADGKPRKYIACQGPLSETINDFWWMIWNENVQTIVMLTREEEKDTAKCERYWPNEGILTSSHFKIKFLSTEDVGNFNVIHKRTLSLKLLSTSEKRIITHFHYTEWPDYGVPGSPFAFMNLVHDVDSILRSKPNSPLCVHCSAGIGRTGTFFAVHMITHQIREWYSAKKIGVPEINIIETVLKLREQRAGMVQTKGQFVFIYNAILFEYELLLKELNSGVKMTIAEVVEKNQSLMRSTRKRKVVSSETS